MCRVAVLPGEGGRAKKESVSTVRKPGKEVMFESPGREFERRNDPVPPKVDWNIGIQL